MVQFSTDEIVVPITATTNPFGKKLRFVERMAARRAPKIGRTFRIQLDRQIKQSRIAPILTEKIQTRFKAGRLAEKKGAEFTSKFNSQTKGLLKGINFGALGFGLNVATLAFSAISNAARKAREEQERYRAELELFNTAVANNDAYIKESNRLKEIATDNSLSVSEKFNLMTRSAEQLDQALQNLIKKEKDELLKDISGPLNDLIRARDELRKENERLLREIDPRNRPINEKTVPQLQFGRIVDNEKEIEKLNGQIAPKQDEVDRINEAASVYAQTAKATREYQLEFIDLTQRRANAIERGNQIEVDTLDDLIFKRQIINQLINAGTTDYKNLAEQYLNQRQSARRAGRQRQKQFMTRQTSMDEMGLNEVIFAPNNTN